MRRRAVATHDDVKADAEKTIAEPLILKARTEDAKTRRAAQMSVLYHDQGWSLEKVGVAYNLTRERIRQVFADYGLETRSPLGSQNYQKPADLSNLRRIKSQRRESAVDQNGHAIPGYHWASEFDQVGDDEEVVLDVIHSSRIDH